jgi:hypothetical protein
MNHSASLMVIRSVSRGRLLSRFSAANCTNLLLFLGIDRYLPTNTSSHLGSLDKTHQYINSESINGSKIVLFSQPK